MLLLSLLPALLLPLLASTTPIHPRAGSPTPVPIPSNCTLTSPLPAANTTTNTTSGYQPTSNFTAAHLVYSSYFDGFLSQSAQATECLEQCYGFGDPGDCKAAVLAYQVPTPKGYYGTAGGVLETACLLFDAYLNGSDFVAAVSGQYVNETVGNIHCPA